MSARPKKWPREKLYAAGFDIRRRMMDGRLEKMTWLEFIKLPLFADWAIHQSEQDIQMIKRGFAESREYIQKEFQKKIDEEAEKENNSRLNEVINDMDNFIAKLESHKKKS